MKPGDKVRVSPGSPWRTLIGDEVGTVIEVSEADWRGTVRFPVFGYAQGWLWAEFDVVEVASAEVLDLAECGCSEEG